MGILKVIAICLLILPCNPIFGQNKMGYGLVLPTDEQTKSIPYVPRASLSVNRVLPRYKDLSSLMPPVRSQGSQGSCSAWAVCYALKSYQKKLQMKWGYIQGGQIRNDRLYSPSFAFNIAKARTGNSDCRSGVQFAVLFDVMKEYGTSFLSDFDYDETDCLTLPDSQKILKGQDNRMLYEEDLRITTDAGLEKIKYSISLGKPVVWGIKTDDHFQEDGFAAFKAGKTYTYIPRGLFTDYHAVLCVGYDNDSQMFKIQNSWGNDWGNDGFAFVPYKYFLALVPETYVINDYVNLAFNVAPIGRQVGAPSQASNIKYDSWFKAGYYHEYKGIRFGLSSLNKGLDQARVVFSTLDSSRVFSEVTYDLGVPKTFYNENKRITFLFKSIGRAGKNPLKKAVFFSIQVEQGSDIETTEKLNAISTYRQQKAQIDIIQQQQQQQR